MKLDNIDLKEALGIEKEKQGKLKSIAEDKYKINFNKIDSYLPKDKEF